MKVFDWAALLRHHSSLGTLDEKTLCWLLSEDVSTEYSYEPGAVIVREGEIGDSIFLIGSGSAEAVLCAGDQPIVLSLMRRGETFGEMGFFQKSPRSATVRARDTCVVMEIKGQELRHLATAHPEVGLKVLFQVSERLRNKNEQIMTLHLKSVEAASRAKDEFVAMLGHELRNPLGAITAAIHLLNARGDSDNNARLRGIITRQTRHLSRLVEDLLDVSKLVSGKIILHRQTEDLREVAEMALASFHEAGKATRHVISLTGDPVRVHGDSTRLAQIVSNLLDNAVKYTPSGGRVELTILAAGPEAVLTVRDTGVGIAQDVLPSIFDIFMQANQPLERSEGGLGVGLTIVKRLVELHGGTVSVSSAGPNRGSEFVVRLPRVSEAAVDPPSINAEFRSSSAHHILIIEDNRDFRVGLRLLLESWGHRVEEAASGTHGLRVIEFARPDVILVDLGLPGIDGYAVARAVRSSPEGNAILLVAITGYGTSNDRRRAKDAGFDAHLTKPVSSRELAEVLLLKD